ncbi:MAG: HDOD domain-containing protein [Desulfobulbaceae bacterium]|nr:HDOD domain-containing protein [Desulfobulbaceae bacterium]
MSTTIAKRLDQIEDLPTVPHTMQRVLSEIQEVSSSAQSLQKIIEQDPVITAKILQMANSAYYSPKTEISSVARAIVTMGFMKIRDLVISVSLTGMFCEDLGYQEFQSKDLWLHAIGVGIGAQLIAKKVPGLDPDDMFTAGMLHDLGRLVYCLYFYTELGEALDEAKTAGVSLNQAEENLGLTHAEIGAYLAQRWKLSDLLVAVIRYHHHPQDAGDYAQAAAVVTLADSLAKYLQIGWSGLGEKPGIKIPKSLGLDVETVKAIAQQLKDEKDKIIESWGEIIS